MSTGSLSIPGNQWERYGQFGGGGYQVGQSAIGLLAGLEAAPTLGEWTSAADCWDEDDVDTFEHFGQLDTGIRFIDPHPDTDGEDIAQLHREFQRLRGAVPLSEGERQWVFDSPPYRPERGATSIIGKTDEIMEAGVLRVVQGRDLARQWWAWRRERDEFAGQGGLTQAREALGSMALKLVSEAHWPLSNRDLLDQLSAN